VKNLITEGRYGQSRFLNAVTSYQTAQRLLDRRRRAL